MVAVSSNAGSGNPNTSVIGSYRITYSATDKSGNTSTATRIVNVIPPVDNTLPIVTLYGSSNITISLNSVFSDPGATSSDDIDGSHSHHVR